MNLQSCLAFLLACILFHTTLADYGQHCYGTNILSPTPATMLQVAKFICDGEKYVSFNTDCQPNGCCNLIEAWYNGTSGGHREQCISAYKFIVRELIQNRGHQSDFFEYLTEDYIVQYHVGATFVCYRSPESMSTLLSDGLGVKPENSILSSTSSTISRVSLPTGVVFKEVKYEDFEGGDDRNWEFDRDRDRELDGESRGAESWG
ncbi:hypothetical protein HYFRA_00011743 [Hymenoscyphus fraxineus]|uniref:Uncharacterized protein n=1 Tax=Hymenoscyphus fraxineus TaxID=746836 RepID=A0A9N9PYK8_9HELO|nr:hypothetical protein HYFRA_00011743 [Hymenoscyphus fraxineus]